LEKASLDGYRNRFITTKGSGHPWADLDTKEFLRNLGGWRKDRERGVEGPTRAGLLMFGKLQAITSPGVAPKYAVDFRDYRDRKARQRWADRVFSDGTWEANLFQFYQYVWPKLVDQLKVPFVLEGPQRVDNTPVHDALREAIGNAFIHADYTVGGGIVIERHDHRFHFANPGTLLVSHEQLRRGGVSECRNPNLQRMFMMIGVGEQAGSGYAIIREGWKTQHWRTPWISTQDAPERVRLEMPMISLMPERAFDALYTHMGSTFNRLGERERIALVTAFIEGEVSNVRMQDLVDYHPSDITKLLRGLVAKGLLHTDNRRRWTRYSLPAGVAPQTDLFSSQDSSHYGGNSSHYELKSEESATQCEELDKHINEVANKGRVSRETMEAAIRALCAHSPQTLNELATRLNRKPGGLRNHYLTPMVRSGKLALTYPNQPNHPNQSYTTVQTEE
jgi:ATP-dependent DNA helicase RecG